MYLHVAERSLLVEHTVYQLSLSLSHTHTVYGWLLIDLAPFQPLKMKIWQTLSIWLYISRSLPIRGWLLVSAHVCVVVCVLNRQQLTAFVHLRVCLKVLRLAKTWLSVCLSGEIDPESSLCFPFKWRNNCKPQTFSVLPRVWQSITTWTQRGGETLQVKNINW